MNRLTETIDGIVTSKERYEKYSPCHGCQWQSTDDCLQEECTYASVLNKLAAYEDTGLEPEEISPFSKKLVKSFAEIINDFEDLEKQGLLIKLPCKEKDTIYILDEKGSIHECEVYNITTNIYATTNKIILCMILKKDLLIKRGQN